MAFLTHLPCIQSKQKQRQHLKRGEHTTKRNNSRRFGNPVEVMGYTNRRSDKEKHHSQENNPLCHHSGNQTHLNEHVADDDGCEHFESDLNPHVYDHPTPIV